MKPRIENIEKKYLLGKKLSMSFSNYNVGELWSGFMFRRKEIVNNLNNELISLAIYAPNHFKDFKITNEFEKWAAVEVSNFENIPTGMETLILKGGLYAVFDYQGLSTDSSVFNYIYGTWLPTSAYLLDDRPHFEILGDKYKNNDPLSEEEIWIPIVQK